MAESPNNQSRGWNLLEKLLEIINTLASLFKLFVTSSTCIPILTSSVLISGGSIAVYHYYPESDEDRIRELQQQISALEGKVPPLQQQISTLEGQVLTLEGKVPPLQQQVSTLEDKVPPLQQQVSTLEDKVPPLQQQVSTLEGKVSALEANLVPQCHLERFHSIGPFESAKHDQPTNALQTQLDKLVEDWEKAPEKHTLQQLMLVGRVDIKQLIEKERQFYGSDSGLAQARAKWAWERLKEKLKEKEMEVDPKRIILLSAGPLHVGNVSDDDRSVEVYACWAPKPEQAGSSADPAL